MDKLDQKLVLRLFNGKDEFKDTDETFIDYLPKVYNEENSLDPDSFEPCVLVLSTKAMYVLFEARLVTVRIPWEYIADYKVLPTRLDIAWMQRKSHENIKNVQLSQFKFRRPHQATHLWSKLTARFVEQIEATYIISETINFQDKHILKLFVRPVAGQLYVSAVEKSLIKLLPDELEILKVQMSEANQRMLSFAKDNQETFVFSTRKPERI
jgi:hypothetical protein